MGTQQHLNEEEASQKEREYGVKMTSSVLKKEGDDNNQEEPLWRKESSRGGVWARSFFRRNRNNTLCEANGERQREW